MKNFKNVTKVNQKTSIPNIILKNLLPEGNRFYEYSGSLATPPCTENVNWIVFGETVKISENQVINRFEISNIFLLITYKIIVSLPFFNFQLKAFSQPEGRERKKPREKFSTCTEIK